MRTWRPPLAEIGTGRHALAIYWLNSGHGERYRYRHCAWAWDDAKQHKTQYLVRAGSPLSLRYHSDATVPTALRAPSLLVPPLTPSRSLEPLANLDKHSTHTLTPPKNSPSRPCTPDHPRPGSAKPSRLKAIISLEPSPFFGRYVVAVVASPLHRPPDRDRIALTNCLGADTGCLLPRIAATTIWRHGRSRLRLPLCPNLRPKRARAPIVELPKSPVLSVGRVSAPRQPPVIFGCKRAFGATNGTVAAKRPLWADILFSLLFSVFFFSFSFLFFFLIALEAWKFKPAQLSECF